MFHIYICTRSKVQGTATITSITATAHDHHTQPPSFACQATDGPGTPSAAP